MNMIRCDACGCPYEPNGPHFCRTRGFPDYPIMDKKVARALECLDTLQRVGDFRNGVTDQSGSSDEGEYLAAGLFDQVREALKASSPVGVDGMREALEAKLADYRKRADEYRERHGLPFPELVIGINVMESLLREAARASAPQSVAAGTRDDGIEEAVRAFDNFSKAFSTLPGTVQVAVQKHDPTWEAWKALCHAMAALKSKPSPQVGRQRHLEET